MFLEKTLNYILKDYSPVSLLTDDNHNILSFNGDQLCFLSKCYSHGTSVTIFQIDIKLQLLSFNYILNNISCLGDVL